jgi:hypothetical protein
MRPLRRRRQIGQQGLGLSGRQPTRLPVSAEQPESAKNLQL